MRSIILVIFSLVLAPLAFFSPPAEESSLIVLVSSTNHKDDLRATIKGLPVKPDSSSSYSRDAYSHWSDLDGDSCDSRIEVFMQETKTPITGSNCDLTGGSWISYFDGVKTSDPSTFDVDHLVPLAEAHRSGGYRWDADTRERYANDLQDGRTLVAVSASSNRSKSDRDPTSWVPPKKSAHCRYLFEWVSVKVRWSLSVDSSEKAKLSKMAKDCKNRTVRVTKARIGIDQPVKSSSGLKVTTIQYDPPGTDTLNGEWISFTNESKSKVSLKGWRIEDSVGTSHTFTSGALRPGKTVRLYTGSGQDSHPTYFAGKGSAWWNNSGDSFKLYEPAGKLMDSGTYTGDGSGKVTFS